MRPCTSSHRLSGSSAAPRRHLLNADRVSGTFLVDPPRFPGVDEVRLYEVDLLDAAGLERAVRDAAPDAIVNLAGLSHVGESWKRMGEYFQVNVIGTENLLAAAGGRPVVVASSAEVYGSVPEDEPVGRARGRSAKAVSATRGRAERLPSRARRWRRLQTGRPGQAPAFPSPPHEQLAASGAASASRARRQL